MRQAVVHSGQSIFDIAIQHCGSVDAAYDVAVLNSLPLDAILMPGQTLLIPKVTDKRVVDEFERRGVVPGTVFWLVDEPKEEGLEFWYLEIDFVIS